MPWLAAVGAGVAGLVGAGMQSGAQDRATQAQREAGREALGFARNQWDTTRADFAPYRQYGQMALPGLYNTAMNAGNIDPTSDAGYNPVNVVSNPGQFNFSTEGPLADPSYTWRLNQGLDAVNSSAAGRGGYFSGNTGKALMDYGQGSASQEYGAQFGRYNRMFDNYMNQEGFNANQYQGAYDRQLGTNQNQYNQFSGIANLGANAVNSTGQLGSNFANNAGNVAINQGNNAAAGYMNNAGAWSNALTNAANQFTSYAGNQAMADALRSRQFSYGPAF